MLRRYLHAIQGNYVRIARIQVNSPLRNQMLYPDHYYEISVRLNEIYTPGRCDYYKPKILRIYASKSKIYYYTNNNVLFTKTTTDGDITYIDVAIVKETYSTSIDVKIDTTDEGSVSLMQDKLSQNDFNTYVRIDGVHDGCIMGSKKSQWMATGNSTTYNVSKDVTKIIALTSGDTAYVFNDQKVNYDNNSMTVTVDDTDTYFNKITITAKVQGWFVIEA